MPAYNEEKRIGNTLKDYSDFFSGIARKKNVEYEILVVINNTSDKTEDVVKKYQRKDNRIRYLNLVKGGKGYATTEGFKDALKRKNDFIGFVDADLATSAREYWKLIENLGTSDGIIADRYSRGAEITPAFSFRRVIVSRAFNYLVRILFGFKYRDTQCGAKLFTRRAIEKIIKDLTITQWAYDIDLLYAAEKNGLTIKSFPTQWTEIGGSKLNLVSTSIEMFFAVIQLRLLRSRFKTLLPLFRRPIGKIYRFIRNL